MMSGLRIRAALAGVAVLVVLGVAACGGAYSGGSSTSAAVQPMNSGSVASNGSSASSATAGIPQNNGGDHDADNNGGPSDGDGNI